VTVILLVKNHWAVENLERVGGGCLFSLAYHLSQLSAPAQAALAGGAFLPETPVEIYWLRRAGEAERVAEGRLSELVQTDSTLRFDIRLLRVRPFIQRCAVAWPDPIVAVALAETKSEQAGPNSRPAV